MKKLIWTIILGGASLIICGLCLFYTNMVSDTATEYVNNVYQYVEDEEYNAAKTELNALEEYWDNQSPILSLMIHHEILENIEETIKLVNSALKNTTKDEKIEFEIETSRSLIQLKNLKSTEIPTFDNIF